MVGELDLEARLLHSADADVAVKTLFHPTIRGKERLLQILIILITGVPQATANQHLASASLRIRTKYLRMP
jgi:hypothetical protein